MSATWQSFERFKQRGLDARRAGQWDSARTYLLEAARNMTQLAKDAKGEELRDAREQTARKLLALAKDCADARDGKRPPPGVRRKSGKSGREEMAESDGEDANDGNRFLVKEKPGVTFADVAGLEDVKQDIRLKMLHPFEHPELAEKFGIRAGGGVLLYGPPGTGKTMLAKATAGELDAAFFTVSPAEVLSKWVGEAEQNLQALFAAAKSEPRSVIFIDEIEALAPARRDEGGSGVMQRLVPQLLQGMEGFHKNKESSILFMGATNVPWQIDAAVLRPGRFDEKVHVPLPDEPARRKMLDLYLAHRPLADGLDLDALAARLAGYSGADIKYICDRAAVLPFLKSVAGDAAVIDAAILDAVLDETPPSVSPAQTARFRQWEQARGT
jgi:transitional endoplasmic reticulum ATPase